MWIKWRLCDLRDLAKQDIGVGARRNEFDISTRYLLDGSTSNNSLGQVPVKLHHLVTCYSDSEIRLMPGGAERFSEETKRVLAGITSYMQVRSFDAILGNIRKSTQPDVSYH